MSQKTARRGNPVNLDGVLELVTCHGITDATRDGFRPLRPFPEPASAVLSVRKFPFLEVSPYLPLASALARWSTPGPRSCTSAPGTDAPDGSVTTPCKRAAVCAAPFMDRDTKRAVNAHSGFMLAPAVPCVTTRGGHPLPSRDRKGAVAASIPVDAKTASTNLKFCKSGWGKVPQKMRVPKSHVNPL